MQSFWSVCLVVVTIIHHPGVSVAAKLNDRAASVKLSLTITGNSSLDSSEMIKLGFYLERLDIDMENMEQWPEEMRHLGHLERLWLRKVPALPENAFHGLEDSLEDLNIFSSNLTHSPDAICSLTRLKRLCINDTFVSSAELIPKCARPMTSVKHLYFDLMDVAFFPDVFATFPNVSIITITSSNVRYLDDHLIPGETVVTYLNMRHNKLNRIPPAVNKLKALQTLDLQYNAITAVESDDITDMPNLNWISLYGNPLEYISETAFTNSGSIAYLDLPYTNLTTIPKAILHLPALEGVWLFGAKIKCSCNLYWLIHWERLPEVAYNGFCENSVSKGSISEYIETKLPLCDPIPIG